MKTPKQLQFIFVIAILMQCCYIYAQSSVTFEYSEIKGLIGHTLIGDMNGDGLGDIILHEHIDRTHIHIDDRQTRLSWFKYPELENFTIALGNFTGERFAIDDINLDGYTDVITAVASEENGNIDIFWYENPLPESNPTDQHNWKGHEVGSHNGAVKDICIGDIDSDGIPDIAIRAHEFTSIFLQKKQLWKSRKVNHPDHEGLDLADLDYDGDMDLILNGFWLETPNDPLSGEYAFHTIDDKWYTQQTGSWQDNNCYVGVADLDNDGILDIVLSHSEKEGYPLSWYSVESMDQAKTGPWQEHKVVAVFDWCETVEIGDVDLDGNLDIMAAKFRRHNKPGEGVWNEPPYPVSVFYNSKGNASEWERQDIDMEGIYAGTMGDLGSDGDLDIIGPLSYYTGPVRIWENNNKILNE